MKNRRGKAKVKRESTAPVRSDSPDRDGFPVVLDRVELAGASTVPVHPFWKWLLLALPVLYFLAYGRYGFSARDDGFVLGLSWRVASGELPHRDFISVRPALFSYVHALSILLMPERLEIVFDRFLFYVMAMASSYWCFAAIDRWIPLSRYHLNKYWMAAIGYIFSVHNFPPMAWTTTDGVFFCCLGLYLMARGPKTIWIVTGMLALVAGAMCKQSFYFMPPLGVLVAGLMFGWRGLGIAAGTLAGAALSLVGLAKALGALELFFKQTTETRARGAIFRYNGFIVYMQEVYLLPSVFLLGMNVVARIRLLPARLRRHALGICVLLLCLAPMAETLYFALKTHGFYRPEWLVRSLLFLGLITCALQWRPRRPEITLIAAFLVLSWCTSATNGYPCPALFSAPLLFAIFHASGGILSRRWAIVCAQLLIWGGLLAFAVGYQFPYQSRPPWECTYDMGKVFKKAGFIKADKDAFELYSKLRELVEKYGTNFKTLPCIPMANYLTSTQSPLPIDWVEDFELPGEWKPVAEKLDQSGAVVFVMKNLMSSELLPTYQFGGINSTVTFYVTKTWKKLESGPLFDVYKKDQLSTQTVSGNQRP